MIRRWGAARGRGPRVERAEDRRGARRQARGRDDGEGRSHRAWRFFGGYTSRRRCSRRPRARARVDAPMANIARVVCADGRRIARGGGQRRVARDAAGTSDACRVFERRRMKYSFVASGPRDDGAGYRGDEPARPISSDAPRSRSIETDRVQASTTSARAPGSARGPRGSPRDEKLGTDPVARKYPADSRCESRFQPMASPHLCFSRQAIFPRAR